MKLLKFFFNNQPRALTPLTEEEYKAQLATDPKKRELAFQMAWDARKFEIELYWKRATYFWAFIATSFAGYLALVSSEGYTKDGTNSHVEVYAVACIGLIMSFAWLFTNKGSKIWQRHWEVHVDLLEDDLMGPLYKTVYSRKTYSVSKINEIVSVLFILVWIVFCFKYLFDKDLINWSFNAINWYVWAISISTTSMICAMQFGYGRGRFGDRPVTMYRRKATYQNEEPEQDSGGNA